MKVSKRYDVTSCTSADAILDASGLNWEPELLAATYAGAEPCSGRSPFYAVVNPVSREPMAYVSPRFRANSHTKVVRDLEPLIQSGVIAPHSVSVWDNGGSVALQFACEGLTQKIGPRSVVSPLLTLTVHHDSAGADRSFFADFDYWCKNQNGQVARISGDGVRHSGQVVSKYEELVEGRIRDLRTGMSERYGHMRLMAESSKRLAGRELVQYFARSLDLAPDSVDTAFTEGKSGQPLSANSKVLKALVGAWREDDHGVPGSAWHAYSAVTRYTTHNEGRNEATRAQRALTGSQERYARAFKEALMVVQ